MRTLVVWCPDWPVVAAVATGSAGEGSSVTADDAVAIVRANRVVACSAAARQEGVRRGLRRREAQGRAPQLRVLEADPAGEARAFEPVAAAVEAFTPGVEILRPGAVALATRGPSRYFGGDCALAEAVAAAVDRVVGGVAPGAPCCRVGVADGRFAAEAATRLAGGPALWPSGPGGPGGAGGSAVLVVPPGRSGELVAPLPVRAVAEAVGDDDLPDLLVRLGIRTLGELAAVPAGAVLARFGPAGIEAHHLARGLDERPPSMRTPPPDLVVEAELDPPAERVETAAFVARALAAELHDRLTALGLVCTRVAIEADTEHGENLRRLWRHDGRLSASAVAERVRWQLDGWLAGGGTSGGISLLRLVPDEVGPDHGHQAGFWGQRGSDEGITRTLVRVQGLLGPDGVVTAVLGGGRHPAEQVRLVPWGDARPVLPPGLPWPGRLPGPAPAVVHVPPVRTEVLDGDGAAVSVSGRGEVGGRPALLALGGRTRRIERWAGPWPVEERWWDGGRRRARFQVVLDDGAALLVVRKSGSWWVEATYD